MSCSVMVSRLLLMYADMRMVHDYSLLCNQMHAIIRANCAAITIL